MFLAQNTFNKREIMMGISIFSFLYFIDKILQEISWSIFGPVVDYLHKQLKFCFYLKIIGKEKIYSLELWYMYIFF